MAGLCNADNEGGKFFDMEFPKHLWSKNACNTEFALLAPSMMSDTQLMTAAASFRDGAMPGTHRLLNNLWLSNHERNATEQDAVALGEIMSLGYFSYRPALTDQALDNPLQMLHNPHNESSVITHLKGYDLELSGRTVMLSLRREI